MKLVTESHLAAGGDAVARAPDGRVVFIEGACPSEQVLVEIVKDNSRFLRARVVEVLEPSPARVSPPCPYYGVCGGCSLQHVSASEQLASKEAAVLETVSRIGGHRVALEPSWSGAEYGYRTRARIAVDRYYPRDPVASPKAKRREEVAGSLSIGYRKKDSREIVDVERCAVLTESLNAELAQLRRSKPKFGEHELGAAKGIFSQSNDAGNEAMVAHIADLSQGSVRVLELYAGSGNFTRILPKDTRAVEQSAAAVRAAKERGIAIVEASVEEWIAREKPGYDLIVLDPPRIGASAEVIEHLLRLHPARIIYASCDPATFSRDAKKLGAAYRLDRLRVFDLYPQTAHVEIVGLFC
jgi:23S rRNA (uracil1939-C5)-methyltransferase